MLVKVIIFICFFCILPIMYFLLRNDAKPKKNIILGVTLPLRAREEADVREISRAYRYRLTAVAVVLALPGAALLLIESVSVYFTLESVWLLAVLLAFLIVYATYNRRLSSLKRLKGWGTATVSLVDITVAAKRPKKLSAFWFLPPFVISLLPILSILLTQKSEPDFAWMLAGQAIFPVMILLFLMLQRIIYRQRAEIIDAHTSLTEALTRVRRYNWSKSFIWFSYLTAVFGAVFWFLTSQSALAADCLGRLYGPAPLCGTARGICDAPCPGNSVGRQRTKPLRR